MRFKEFKNTFIVPLLFHAFHLFVSGTKSLVKFLSMCNQQYHTQVKKKNYIYSSKINKPKKGNKIIRQLLQYYVCVCVSVYVLVVQSCPTLCNPMDCSWPGSSIHGILQARILEWVVMPFSRGLSQPRDQPTSPALQADSLPSELPGKSLPYHTEH